MKKDKFHKYVWLIGVVIVGVVGWWLFVGGGPVVTDGSAVPAVPSIRGPNSAPDVKGPSPEQKLPY